MPPQAKRTQATGTSTTRSSTAARSQAQATAAATHLDTVDDSGEVFDDPDHDDADDSSVEQASKATGKKATISAPSVPSELATSTTQGRTAFDVRYFFNIPDKTCYRCK